MPTFATTPVPTIVEFPGPSDRQHGSRTPALYSLLYSGMDNGQKIALSVDPPGMGEPLCITWSRVSWVAGRRLGMDLGTLKLEENPPSGFFLWYRIGHLDYDRCI